MTKADLVAKISDKLGIEKGDVQATVECFMDEVKTSLESGDNVYLRGFGSFIIKTRAEKTGLWLYLIDCTIDLLEFRIIRKHPVSKN